MGLTQTSSYNALSFNGVDNYLAVDITQAQIATYLPTTTPAWRRTNAIYMKVQFPSDVALDSSPFSFSDVQDNDAYHRFALYVNSSNNDRLNIKGRNAYSGSLDYNATAKQFDPNQDIHILLLRDNRSGYSWEWFMSRLYINGTLIGQGNNYENIDTTLKKMTIGAQIDNDAERFCKMILKKFAFYSIAGAGGMTSGEIATLAADQEVTDGRIIYYDIENEGNVVNQDNPGTYDGILSTSAPTYVSI